MRTKDRASRGPARRPPDSANLLRLYRACLKNVHQLLEEAELLLASGSAARAFVLGFTALEEVGKSQFVADFLNDQVSETEFLKAFREHPIKLAYLGRVARIPADGRSEATIDYEGLKLDVGFSQRNNALYVNHGSDFEPRSPADAITPDQARQIIVDAKQHIEELTFAEELNGRIGSKGLFK